MTSAKKIYRRINRYVPAASMIVIIITIICAAIHITASKNSQFADNFNQSISSGVRAFLAHLTGWIPFSLGEGVLLFSPVIITAMLVKCLKISKKSWRRVIRYVIGLLSVICAAYSIFVFAFAAGYHTPTLDTKLEYERNDVSAEQLYYTAEYILEDISTVIDDIDFLFAGKSVMPFTYNEMNDLLIEAYDKICEKYDFIQKLDSNVKRIILSEPMTYTHISGVYSFFTGEANINTNYPDFVIPYTAAHELAHQRGFARENEANFIAFIVCLESDNPYIKYSALINMYQYVSSSLATASIEYYYYINQTLDKRIAYELSSYSTFFDKYRESKASEITGTINNTFLTLQGTEGTKSYGMVVDLAVAYYLN